MLSVPKSPKTSQSLLDNPATPITRKLVLAQLEDMGYARDILPDAVIDAFLLEINGDLDVPEQHLDQESLIEFSSARPQPHALSNQQGHSITKNTRTLEHSGIDCLESRYDYTPETSVLDDAQYDTDSLNDTQDATDITETVGISSIMDRLAAIDLTRARETVESQKFDPTESSISIETDACSHEFTDRLPLRRPPSGCTSLSISPKVIRPVPIIKRKKNDPVSRYHQHQKEWSRDQFLKRSVAKMAHPASGGSVVRLNSSTSKPRHNLAAMRSDYVVPTSKSRRDVIWDVRHRMAQL